ncbi:MULTISPECIES: hypothetical protein [unclassified Mesorhizobium]|nr:MULTISPECIES: hypothetical protein [unclassified Mesorhizobium]
MNRASHFRRELEIDAEGLVADYLDFWRKHVCLQTALYRARGSF